MYLYTEQAKNLKSCLYDEYTSVNYVYMLLPSIETQLSWARTHERRMDGFGSRYERKILVYRFRLFLA